MRVGDVKSRVNDGNVVAAAFMKLPQEYFRFLIGKSVLVIIEVSVSMHVVNVIPIISLDCNCSKTSAAIFTNQMFSRGIWNFSKVSTTSCISVQLL